MVRDDGDIGVKRDAEAAYGGKFLLPLVLGLAGVGGCGFGDADHPGEGEGVECRCGCGEDCAVGFGDERGDFGVDMLAEKGEEILEEIGARSPALKLGTFTKRGVVGGLDAIYRVPTAEDNSFLGFGVGDQARLAERDDCEQEGPEAGDSAEEELDEEREGIAAEERAVEVKD